jgi:hypothetical protein
MPTKRNRRSRHRIAQGLDPAHHALLCGLPAPPDANIFRLKFDRPSLLWPVFAAQVLAWWYANRPPFTRPLHFWITHLGIEPPPNQRSFLLRHRSLLTPRERESLQSPKPKATRDA